MSALGQERTSPHFGSMSALPPKADVDRRHGDVRKVPEADITTDTIITETDQPRRVAPPQRVVNIVE
jgi:hypothetical protein